MFLYEIGLQWTCSCNDQREMMCILEYPSPLSESSLGGIEHFITDAKRNAYSTWDSRIVSNFNTNQARRFLSAEFDWGSGISILMWP
jgi:hypothetical protein